MRAVVTLVAVLGLALTAPAMAQSTGAVSNSGTGSSSNSGMNSGANSSTSSATQVQPGQMQEALKHDLSQAGFTDIQVMPSSFMVRAKDKTGRPVMMVINPDSVTEVTNVGSPGNSGTNTTTK